MAEDDGFLSRWARRKEKARRGDPLEPEAASAPLKAVDVAASEQADSLAQAQGVPSSSKDMPSSSPPTLPTLADVESLSAESNFARFVAPEVSGEVRNAALKKLFSDPHFNVMDGLDTYIDDYNKPDPLPAALLKKMAQSAYLGLSEPEAEKIPQRPVTEDVSEASASAIEQAEEQTNQPEFLPQPPDQQAAGNVSAVAMKAHDEDTDLRLQSHHPPGSPGSEPGAGEDARRQH